MTLLSDNSDAAGTTEREHATDRPGPDAWCGAAAWTREGRWWQPWRVQPSLLRFTLSSVLTERAKIPNGVRWSAHTDAETIEFDVRGDFEHASTIDLFVDGQFRDTVPTGEQETTVHWELGPGEKLVEIWLPHSGRTKITDLRLTDHSHVTPQTKPRLCTYGSSITQCNAAISPSQTWPALVARHNDWDLVNLGMAGQCHLDQPMADAIIEAEPDLVSLCLGINVYTGSSHSERTLPSAVTGFVRAVRRGLPNVPIVAMTPIASPTRELTPNAVGLTLQNVRALVDDAYQLLAESDPHITLVNGLDILDEASAHLLHDGLHPGPNGYRSMATRLEPILRTVMTTARR